MKRRCNEERCRRMIEEVIGDTDADLPTQAVYLHAAVQSMSVTSIPRSVIV